VRSQAKCVGASGLTSNLRVSFLCSLSAIQLNPQGRHGTPYCFFV
jgi:hypothetical protein